MANSASIFSEKEVEYLRSQHLARIATSSPDGIPDVAPVGFDFDGSFFYIGGMNVTKTTKYRNILKNNNVTLVIDDLKTINPWDPRGIKIYGTAEIVTREELPGGQLRDNDHFRPTYISINDKIDLSSIFLEQVRNCSFSSLYNIPNLRNAPVETKKGNISKNSPIRDMECPHCLVAIAPDFYPILLPPNVSDKSGKKCIIYSAICPACKGRIIYNKFVDKLPFGLPHPLSTTEFEKVHDTTLIFPTRKKPKPFSSDVPSGYVKEYEEAYRVLKDSPKASAALSRRLLQRLLEEKAKIKEGDLSYEIQQVIDSQQLSKQLADSIDYVRNIGNFAAHPSKSTTTGQIVDVEAGEAEWNLYVLEQLFDHYFVKPEENKRKQKALNRKLKKLGKPLMKTSGSQSSNPP